jgi:G3E family GTPase
MKQILTFVGITAMKKIPFHIISGFLGSGKTTFLKKIINDYSGKLKLGIIQNEFAPSNVDGLELKKTGNNFDLLEINNGSVFCVCLLGDFVRSLEKFIEQYHPDVLVLEASGLSDTTSIAEVLSSGKLAEKIVLASNWCVVDAGNFKKVGLMKQRVMHQLRMADVIIINKMDLIEEKITLADIQTEIKKINPFAKIRFTSFCSTDFGLDGTGTNKFYLDEMKPLARPDINSMVIKSGKKFSREALQIFLDHWAPRAYRIKGYVNLKNGETVAVQCTFDTVEISDIENQFGATELVALSHQFNLREWNRSFRELK